MNKPLKQIYNVVTKHLGFNVNKIHPRVSEKIYQTGSTTNKCDGSCCHNGTTLTLIEKRTILKKTKLVSQYMTNWLRNHPNKWFNKTVMDDDDFTGGKTTFTAVYDSNCVFLRKDKMCALQMAGAEKLNNPWALKPSVCLLWPLCVHDKMLDVGMATYANRRQCCSPMRNGGVRTVLQVTTPDARFLRQMTKKEISRGGGPPRS